MSRVIGRAEEVREGFALLADEASRNEALAHIAFRLHLDFTSLGKPVPEDQYFPPDVVQLRADERFVDCGAYDGDTIASFLSRASSGFESIVAFEPDPISWGALNSN